MNNADLFCDRLEAIAYVINNKSAIVDYIDRFAPYDLKLESEYDMYLNPHYETKGNRDEFVVLSQWYKDHADKDDADEVYSFFIEAFNKSTIDNALNNGSNEAIASFLKHAHAKANMSYSERELLSDLEVINEIICDRQKIRQGE